MSVIEIKESNFSEIVEKSTDTFLVDFWATWCMPCKMIAPIVEKISEEYSGKIKVGKVNVDEEQNLAVRFGIASIPTLLVFKNGKVHNAIVGVAPKEKIIEKLDL